MTAGPMLDDLWDDWKPTEQTALDFLLESGLTGMSGWKRCKQYLLVIKPPWSTDEHVGWHMISVILFTSNGL